MKTEVRMKRAFLDAFRKEIKEKFGEAKFDIRHIQLIAKIYCKAIAASNNLWSSYGASDLPITDKDIQWVSTVATAVFLESWLENDSRARQTIYSFTQSPFMPRNESTQGNKLLADTDFAISLGRARDKHEIMQRRRQEQIEDDNICIPLGRQTESTNERSKTYNFIDLCIFDMWAADGQWSLLDFLFFQWPTGAHQPDNWWSKKLESCYVKYYDNLSRINQLFQIAEGMAAPEPSICRQYVASCMAIRKIEQANRISLIYNLSQSTIIEKMDFHKHGYYAAIYWGRYPALDTSIIRLNSTDIGDKSIEDIPHDIGNYGENIENVFGDSSKEKEAKARKHRAVRAILHDVLVILHTLYPTSQLPHWEDIDFLNAAYFYRNTYPFIKEFLQYAQSDTDPPSLYLNCKKLFQELMQVDNSQLSRLINCNAYEKVSRQNAQ